MRSVSTTRVALALLWTALTVSPGLAQGVSEFRVRKPPTQAPHAAPQRLSFTLTADNADITGARIYLVPIGKSHSGREAWVYVGMVSFFPTSSKEQATFDLPLPKIVQTGQKMIAEPIVEGNRSNGSLKILSAAIGVDEH